MKKFNFRLQGALKIREFKEDTIKAQMGMVLKKISSIEDKVKSIEESLNESFRSQESILHNPTNAKMIQFYPDYNSARYADLKLTLKKRDELFIEFEELRKKLSLAKADVKVIESLKEKKFIEHKKEILKKETMEIEESYSNSLLIKGLRK